MTGFEVKKVLKNSGFSLKHIADLMGETPQNLNSMLSAQDIKTGTLERISIAIKKNLCFFFSNEVDSINNSINHSVITTNENGSQNVNSGNGDKENCLLKEKITGLEQQIEHLKNTNDFLQNLVIQLTQNK